MFPRLIWADPGACLSVLRPVYCAQPPADVVNALLATGAHVNLVSRAPAGVSALMAAAQHGHSKVCESLMNGANNAYTKVCASARADVNLTNDFGANALSMAARGGHLECVALLLRRGARRGTLDMHGMTALHIAAKGNHARICIELMRHEGADAAADSRTVDPIAADKRGRSALELAAEAGAFAAVRAMLEAPQCRPAHVLRAHALAVAAGKHAVAAQLMAFHTRPQVRFRSEDGASTRALGLAVRRPPPIATRRCAPRCRRPWAGSRPCDGRHLPTPRAHTHAAVSAFRLSPFAAAGGLPNGALGRDQGRGPHLLVERGRRRAPGHSCAWRGGGGSRGGEGGRL